MPNLRMAKLEDRIEFLHAKFSGRPVDRSSGWWGQLTAATHLRNQLTHAKGDMPQIGQSAVSSAIGAIIQALQTLYDGIYKRNFPLANRGLQSRLTF
jgi:hypothetical protein